MKEPHYLEVRHGIVKKDNEIIEKGCFVDLSVQQQKIILYLIAQIKPGDKSFKLYEFSIAEFCKTCGIAYNGRTCQDLMKSIDEIGKLRAWVKFNDGHMRYLGWIDYAEIPPKTGKIIVRLNKEMAPYLLQLKRNFTTYELLWTLNFRSKYTIRLYEYIKSVHYHKDEMYIKTCPVDELKSIMGAEKYGQYKGFKQWALLPAIEEINQFSDENLEFEEVKQGRRVVWIKFAIYQKGKYEIMKLKDDIENKFDLNQLTIWDRLEGQA